MNLKKSQTQSMSDKPSIISHNENFATMRSPIVVSGLNLVPKRNSDLDSSSIQVALGDVKLDTSCELPDYEDELVKKRSIFDQDKCKDLLYFDPNDVEYHKVKIEETLKWYSWFDIKEVKQANSLGQRNIESLSSNVMNCTVRYNHEDYGGHFFTLPSFKPTDKPLFKHEFSESLSSSPSGTGKKRCSMLSVHDSSNVIYCGNLKMYPPLIDNTISIENWVSQNKTKMRFFSLNQSTTRSTIRLEYKKDNKSDQKYKGVIFLDFCSNFRQSSAVRENAFEIHINEKIIILVASSSKEFNEWVTAISDASGILLDRNLTSKANSASKTVNLQESLASSGIPALLDYSKETDLQNQKNRAENRYKIYTIYPHILDSIEALISEPDPIYVPGEKTAKRVQFDFNAVKLCVSYIEPFVLIFAIYDIKEAVKISEDFVCEPTDPLMRKSLNYNHGYEVYQNVVEYKLQALKDKTVRSFIFDCPNVHDDIYIVVRVYKLYTSSLNTLWEHYSKTGSKTEAKLGKMFLESSEDGKKYLMPVGFSFKRLFYRHELDVETKFLSLIKHDYKLSSQEMVKFIQEYRTDAKLKSVSVNLEMEYELQFDSATEKNVLSSSYEAQHPFDPKIPKFALEMIDPYNCGKRFRGYNYPINLLFVNLQNLNLSNAKTSEKNFVVSLEIFNTDSNPDAKIEPLPVIFARSCTPGFVRTASTSVVCSCNQANLIEEFKILLPANAQPNFHLLIKYIGVSYKEKDESKKKKQTDDVVGYSWIKLFTGDTIIESKEYNLPAVQTLPQNYLKYDIEKQEKTKSPPELKWVDGSGKSVLKFELKFITNYHSPNSHLYKITKFVDEKGVTEESSSELLLHIKWLYSLGLDVMITHLYAIMNFLFDILHQSNRFGESAKEKTSDIQKNTMRLMLLVCGEICRKGRDDLLRGYVKYRFTPVTNIVKGSIHIIILQYLTLATSYGSDPQMTDNFYLSVWFFLEIILKSLNAEASNNIKAAGSRKHFLKPSAIDHIGELIAMIIFLIKNKSNADPSGVRLLNRKLARFLTRCFAVLDRGVVMRFFAIVIENLSSDQQIFVSMRFDTLTEMSSYENFVQLNLPYYSSSSKKCIADLQDLTSYYSKNHFPLWLILSEVRKILGASYECRKYGIRIMKNLLMKHSYDDRLNNDERMYRVHILYLPFLTILIETHCELEESLDFIGDSNVASSRCSVADLSNDAKTNTQNRKWVTSLKSTSMLSVGKKNSMIEETEKYYNKKDLRDILAMFINLLKSIDINVVMDYLKSISGQGLDKSKLPVDSKAYSMRKMGSFYTEGFLRMLRLCIRMFKRPIIAQKNKKYEACGLGIATLRSARSDLVMKQFISFLNVNFKDLESNLHCEVCLTVLDYLERLLISFKTQLDSENGNNELMGGFINLNVFLLQQNTSEVVRKHHLTLLRQLINKSPQVLFKGSNSYCYLLFMELLKLTGNDFESVRSAATMMTYTILRSDYAYSGVLYHRAYVAVIMASSTVVEEIPCSDFLLDTMKELSSLAKSDKQLGNSEFTSEIGDIVRRVKNIIRLTYRFKELESNVDCLVEAHTSIANSFIGVPEVRQTWLERTAAIHIQKENYSEAAMCYLHIGSMIAVTLKRKNILSEGSSVFKNITKNITAHECNFKETALTDESKHALDVFVTNVNLALYNLFRAERYEIIPDLGKIILPFLEKDDNYMGQSELYGLCQDSCKYIIEKAAKRYLGTYYRVAFFGHSFKEDHGCQFIYKEPKVSPLGETVDRFLNIYTDKCNDLTIIKESTKVKWSELDQDKDYIQINVVKPNYLGDKMSAKANFLSHHNIDAFVLETPFTKSGKAHGNIVDQWKRITIFTTAQSFPFLKKRIPIVKSDIHELNPIEVAIDEMSVQVSELISLVDKSIPDMKRLQLKLQGSVCVTVNAGPIAYANNFLKPEVRSNYDKKATDTLEELFKQFVEICERALELNGKLIKQDQEEYQKGLVSQFCALTERLSEILSIDFSRIGSKG